MKSENQTASLPPDVEQSVEQLSELLKLDADVLRSMVGRRVKGSAEFGRNGSFRFEPSRSTGVTQQEVRKTVRGSKLVHTIGENRLRLTCCAPAGEKDPEGWIADEVNRLLAPERGRRQVVRKVRVIDRGERVKITVNMETGVLDISLQVPMNPKTDFMADVTAALSDVMKRFSIERQRVERLLHEWRKNAD